MIIINKNIAKSTINSVKKTLSMLQYTKDTLNDINIYYHEKFEMMKSNIKNSIYVYNSYIVNLQNSIIYVEKEDENGRRYIESPNIDSVNRKISYYRDKINYLYEVLNKVNNLYNSYYNNIDRKIGIIFTKIKNGNIYLNKILGVQNTYSNLKIESEKNLNENNKEVSKENIINNLQVLANKCIDDKLDNDNFKYAMSQIDKFEIVGGSYSKLKKQVHEENLGYLLEVHHMPPKSSGQILNENKDISPAIIITKKDHEKTRSYGKKLSSLKFQKSQKKLINEKKYTQAFENEKNDIISNFGSRYNKQLNQVENYVQTLIGDGVIDDSGR